MSWSTRANAVAAVRARRVGHVLVVPAAAVEPGVAGLRPRWHGARRVRRAASRRRCRDLALRGETAEVDVGGGVRLRAVPFTTSSGDRGVVVASVLTTPYERSERYALLATVVLGLIVVRHGRAPRPPGHRPGARAGVADGRPRGGLERARPRPAFRPRSSHQRAGRARRDPRRPARASAPERSDPSSASPPSWPTSCAPR